jgi:ankyrin repeat protein
MSTTTKATISATDAVKALRADLLHDFMAAGGDVNTPDGEGMTALHHAAARGARPCIRLLVASGNCDYLIRDNRGRYASDLAIEWARDYAVGRLLGKHQARQAHERGIPAYVPRG